MNSWMMHVEARVHARNGGGGRLLCGAYRKGVQPEAVGIGHPSRNIRKVKCGRCRPGHASTGPNAGRVTRRPMRGRMIDFGTFSPATLFKTRT